MAKVFVAVTPNSEAEKAVVEKLNGYNSSCALGDVFGYTANFYEIYPLDDDNSEQLVETMVAIHHSGIPGMCNVTKAKDFVDIANFMEHCVTE